ncbi:MAG: leucine-rich repeat domain-containing protein [Clostridia bacterium]|nr:leucine-rich repeat domain-containing protein [Clostridia bacterium]
MRSKTSEFFIHASETEKRLFISRPDSIKGTKALSPCCMTPDDVDYEMATGKHPEILEICGMNQQSLEYFVQHYSKSYRYLSFFKCQLIQDFSPLEDLTNLEEVSLYWNIRADRLWDMKKNAALNTIRVADAKKMTLKPEPLWTAPALENVSFSGSIFNNTPMASLDCFAGMSALKQLRLHNIRLQDRRVDVLSALPRLERFDFDAGMFTTEEIAWMVAKHPHLTGSALCAYNTEDAMLNDVRVCGFRKPGLDLPQHQKRLDKYVAQFNALVEKYRNEL